IEVKPIVAARRDRISRARPQVGGVVCEAVPGVKSHGCAGRSYKLGYTPGARLGGPRSGNDFFGVVVDAGEVPLARNYGAASVVDVAAHVAAGQDGAQRPIL